jgi:hypothetical protein
VKVAWRIRNKGSIWAAIERTDLKETTVYYTMCQNISRELLFTKYCLFRIAIKVIYSKFMPQEETLL